MRSLILLMLLNLLLIQLGVSQKEELPSSTKNALFVQYDYGGGTRPSFSARLETTIIRLNNVSYRIYLGISQSQPLINPSKTIWYGVPVGVNIFAGTNKTHFESGFGYWYTKANEDHMYSSTVENFFHVRFGFRYQKLEKTGLIIRLGIKPGVTWFWDYDVMDVSFAGNYYFSVGLGF